MATTDPTDAAKSSQATIAAWAGFVLGFVLGLAALTGSPRGLGGVGGASTPIAIVAGGLAAVAFVTATGLWRRGETQGMPTWQRLVSRASDVAVMATTAAVSGLVVLTVGEILRGSLEGLELPAAGSALLAGVAGAGSAFLSFQLGATLRTSDLANLLFAFIANGSIFAMITNTDPRWWERHFSQLGTGGGAGAWAFNGTLVIAGLLVATIGSYLGRDLHRWMGDAALRRIFWVVALFGLTGISLTIVGLVPLTTSPIAHNIAAFGTLILFGAAAAWVTFVMPGPSRAMWVTTIGVALALAVAVVLWRPLGWWSAAGLEAVAVGLMFVWLTTLVRTIGTRAPDEGRVAQVESPMSEPNPQQSDQTGGFEAAVRPATMGE